MRCSKWITFMTVVAISALTVGCDAPRGGADAISFPKKDDLLQVMESFENADLWDTVDGTWTATKSGDRSVLKQTATDRKFPVTLLREPEFSDLDVSVEFRPLSGDIDASGGIVFRARDGANYYIVRANSLEDNFRLYATVVGDRKQIASVKITAPQIGRWHTLRVVAISDHIQAYLNGELLIDHHDSRFRSGRVGLWTKADAETEFADFAAKGTTK